MAKRTEAPASDETAELRREIADLKDQVKVLTDILDEIREEISWVTRNGLPMRTPLPVSPVLKRMALDPMAVDWGERLQMVRGECQEFEAERPPVVQAPVSREPPPGQLLSKPGEQRRLF